MFAVNSLFVLLLSLLVMKLLSEDHESKLEGKLVWEAVEVIEEDVVEDRAGRRKTVARRKVVEQDVHLGVFSRAA